MAGQRCPALLYVEPLAFETFVQVGDEFAVAVEHQRRDAIAFAEHFLRRLAPARMRHVARIQVFRDFLVTNAQRWNY